MSDDRPQSMFLADLLERTKSHLRESSRSLSHLGTDTADITAEEGAALAREIEAYLDSEYDLSDGSSDDITTDQRTPTGVEAALSAIDGVETAEWIDDLDIIRVTLTNGVSPDVLDRVNDVRPAGASDTRLMGDGQHNAVLVYEYTDEF